MDSMLVIGGSTGIGYELSNKLASQGYDVFATYNQNKVSAEKINLTYHHLNVLDKEMVLSLTDTPLTQSLIDTDEKRAQNEQRQKTQKVPATLDEVWNFVSSPANLKEITPKYMGFDITIFDYRKKAIEKMFGKIE